MYYDTSLIRELETGDLSDDELRTGLRTMDEMDDRGLLSNGLRARVEAVRNRLFGIVTLPGRNTR